MTALLTGIALGIGGSLHCAGMCGPLVLTLGRRQCGSRRDRVRHAALYQLGRVLTYVALGFMTGLIGGALTARGFGRVIAVAAGILLILAALRSIRPVPLGRLPRIGASVGARACGAAARWSRAHPAAGPLATGAANGLLPCGLVYAAVAAAAAFGEISDAALLMAGFAVGTLPALTAVSISASAIPPALRLRLRPLMPVVLALAGVMLLARGIAPASVGHAPDLGHSQHASQ
ncbi:MAG: sulfite exporter TauE/SafE family protein [Vicinamibacterales bacterium]